MQLPHSKYLRWTLQASSPTKGRIYTLTETEIQVGGIEQKWLERLLSYASTFIPQAFGTYNLRQCDCGTAPSRVVGTFSSKAPR